MNSESRNPILNRLCSMSRLRPKAPGRRKPGVLLSRVGIVFVVSLFCHQVAAQIIPSSEVAPSTDMTPNLPSMNLLGELNDGVTTSPNGFWARQRTGTIHFDFVQPYTVDSLKLYNDINVGKEGIDHFQLHFFDASGDSLADPFPGSAPLGSEAPGDFPFPAVNCVSRVDLVILSVHNPPDKHAGAEIREVHFTGRPCSEGSSVLKVCKVAGAGVPVGTMFTFDVSGAPLAVPAGPPPGGYCKVADTNLQEGTTVVVEESGSSRYEVSEISVFPPERLLEASLPQKLVGIEIGEGVTEATFTNVNTRGYVEICKTGPVEGEFTFGVEGVEGTFVIPADACSPAIEVKAGEVSITEPILKATALVGCETIPADRLVSCDPRSGTAVVNVPAGDISTQTIVFIENWYRDDKL